MKIKGILTLAVAMASVFGSSCLSAQESQTAKAPSKVYMIKDVTPENLVKVYKALGREAKGDKIGIKISTGESMKSNHLDTALIAPLVRTIGGNFIECNTAYAGNRLDTQDHLRTAKEHGFTDLAGIDIMDAEGDTILPLSGGFHLKKDIVGKSFTDYDFIVVLSHFKGHAMGGFGGALKNISIGIGSTNGKTYIHSAGASEKMDGNSHFHTDQDAFLESMADAAKAVADHCGDNILYINVANRLSVDCDCDGDPEQPKMADLGVFASLDPVALDRACVDAVYNSTDHGKVHLIERIESRHGTHTLDAAEQLGVGTQNYELIVLE